MKYGRNRSMAVTIYDVAKEAGVSIGTVSKALNDSYTIPDQTKEMIREIADRLGYLMQELRILRGRRPERFFS